MSDQSPDAPTAELPAARPFWKRPAVVGGGLAAAAVVIGAGAFAYTQLAGGGPQPHDVLPDSVVAYARIDLDPSAGQKIAALRLIRKFPELADQIGIKNPEQDVRRLIVDELTKDCDVGFEKDVEPWLGSRVGVGAVGVRKTPDPVVALQVDDEDAARAGLRELERCDGGQKSGLAFLDGYALIAETQAIADRTKRDAAKASLADDEHFAESMSDLGDEGVASAWLDIKSLMKIPEFEQEIPDEVLAQMGKGGLGVTLRAESDALELAMVSHGVPKDSQGKAIDVGSLPASTAAAVGVRMPAKAVRDQWDAAMESIKTAGEDPDAIITAFEGDTGLRLPEDLETLFDGGLTLAIGERNLETIPTLEAPPKPSDFDIGLRIGDPKAADLAERLITVVRDTVGLELSSTETRSGTVIATNAKAFSDTGRSLADTAAFGKVVADDAQQALFLNLATIVEAVASSNPPPEVADVADQMKPLDAFGLDFAQDGDVARGSMTLSFRE